MSDREHSELKHEMYSIPGEAQRDKTLAYLAKEFFGYTNARKYDDGTEVHFYQEPSLEEIAVILKSMSERMIAATDKEDELHQAVTKNSELYYNAQAQITELNKQVTTLTKGFNNAHLAQEKAMRELKKYGGHRADCAYMEIASCGRILRSAEKDNCTCGWFTVRESMKQEIAAQPVEQMKKDTSAQMDIVDDTPF